MICSKEVEVAVSFVNAAVSVAIILFFVFVVCILLFSRRVFHPFFVVLFVILLVSYILTDTFATIMNVTQCTGNCEDNFVPRTADFLSTVFYRNATPTIIFLLGERMYSTMNCGTYEKARPWARFLFLPPLGLALSIADAYLIFSGTISAHTEQFCLAGVYIIVFLMLCLLLVVNKRLTSQYTGQGLSLSMRYQLSENIRALRVVIPVVVFDGLITAENIAGRVIFNISKQFQTERCETETSYFPLFLIVQTISALIECCIPILIIWSHPIIKYNASQWCCGKETKRKDLRKMTNVLGLDLPTTQTSTEYFQTLQVSWQGK